MNANPVSDDQLRISRNRQRLIGRALAELYAPQTIEPTPDDLMQLLKAADLRTPRKAT
jgi:hypothetical protein